MDKQPPLWPWLIKDKQPRGLLVGKLLKDPKYWADGATPVYSDNFYFRIRKVGLPNQLRSIDNANITTLRQAQEYALLQFKAAQMPQIDALRAAVNGTRVRSSAVTLGQFLTAFEAVARARNLREWERARSSLRLVAAIAHGLCEPHDAAFRGKGREALVAKVDALTCEEVFTQRTAMEYARRMQGGDVINLDKALPPEVNGTINSTLCMARVPLGERTRVLQVAELAVDWAKADGFRRLNLPVGRKDVAADLPTQMQYESMLKDWARLAGSENERDQELALCNELLRLLGLRSGELCMARESWLHTGADKRSYVWVKARAAEGWACKGGEEGKLPLSAALAARLRARCEAARAEGLENPFLILPLVPGMPVDATTGRAAEQWQRANLVRKAHNAWLKTHIGEVKSDQGNHRLRKLCATRLYAQLRGQGKTHEQAAEVVREYLRHAKAATTLLHYIAKNDELLPTVTDGEVSGWG